MLPFIYYLENDMVFQKLGKNTNILLHFFKNQPIFFRENTSNTYTMY